MKKHWGITSTRWNAKNSHTPTQAQKKWCAGDVTVVRMDTGSITSGSTKLDLDLAKLTAVFLYLNSLKP